MLFLVKVSLGKRPGIRICLPAQEIARCHHIGMHQSAALPAPNTDYDLVSHLMQIFMEAQLATLDVSNYWCVTIGHNVWRSHFGVDEHPLATYFDVHQGYRVLTHSHVWCLGLFLSVCSLTIAFCFFWPGDSRGQHEYQSICCSWTKAG